MNIAFLVTHASMGNFFNKISDELILNGHSTALFYTAEPKYTGNITLVPERWDLYQFDQLIKFNPQALITFNGHHESAEAPLKFLKTKFPLFYAEVGWLPQLPHLYIDTEMGYGGHISKSFKFSDEPLNDVQKKILEDLKMLYQKKELDVTLPDTFILIPLQLEHDVSIKKDSPDFKLMRTLINYVEYLCPDIPIVVKQHPKGPTKDKYANWAKLSGRNTTIVLDKKDTSLSTPALAFYAKMLIGINSTSLMESMIHEKPIITFGNSVIFEQDKDYNNDNELRKKIYKYLDEGLSVQERLVCQQKLLYLSANQFNYKESPPRWVIDKISNLSSAVRTIQDL